MTPASDRHYEQIGKAYEAIAPFLRHRLFASAAELEPIFHALPAECDDLLFLITSAAPAGEHSGLINPRQSFMWNARQRRITTFTGIDQLAQCILRVPAPSVLTRKVQSIDDAIAQGNCKFTRLDDGPQKGTVYVFSESPCGDELRAFLSVLRTYFELFRTSTTHSHNDIYSTREDELASAVELMAPSLVETTRSLLTWICEQSRFGHPRWCVLEYVNDWKPYATDDPATAALAEKVVRKVNNGKLIGMGKFTVAKVHNWPGRGKDRSPKWVLAAPFSRLHDELSFDGPPIESMLSLYAASADAGAGQGKKASTPRAQPSKTSRSRQLQGGDCAAVLIYEFPPHPNVLHTIVRYRQYYFEVYRPGVINQVSQIIYARAREVHSASRDWTQGDSSLWQRIRQLCDTVLPILFEALDVSGGVSIYQVERDELYTISTWDARHGRRTARPEEVRWLSLKRGQRGMVATAFLDPDRAAAVCNNLKEARNKATGAKLPMPYIEQRPQTNSEYCIKLLYKQTPIGMVNVESIRNGAFTEPVKELIKSFVAALQHYIHEELAAADSHWLAITATSYHNLHELRQVANLWSDPAKKRTVLEAIATFDKVEKEGTGTVGEIEDFLHTALDQRLADIPFISREALRSEALRNCKFRFDAGFKERVGPVPRVRIELLKRIGKNLLSNFDFGGHGPQFRSFKVFMTDHNGHERLHFRQEHAEPFRSQWLDRVGFAPLPGETESERMHHGLFLCGAIARSLGGFLFAGNAQDKQIGPRSRLEIVVPIQEFKLDDDGVRRQRSNTEDRTIDGARGG